MENKFTKLLNRQLKKHYGSLENVPEELWNFINDVNSTYEGYDDDILLLQNSIEISSLELRNAFQKLKQDAENQNKVLSKIREAINALNSSELASGEYSDTFWDGHDMSEYLIRLIDERKRAEEVILRLSLAVEQNPASIVITDLKGKIEYVNKKFCDLTGYLKDEVIGKNPGILKSGYTSSETYKELWKTIRAGGEWKGEFHNKKKSGELYWEYATITAVKNQYGQIINFLAIKEDISERKLSQEILQNERTLFRTIIDLIPDAVYVKDRLGRKIISNPKDVLFSGKESESEVINKTDFCFFSDEIAQKSTEEDEFVIHTGKSIIDKEGELTDKTGDLKSLLISKVPLFDVTGQITGLVGVTHDITERKQAEMQLQAAHKSLSDVLNAAIHSSIIATDVDGIITVFSKGAEYMLGYKAEEMIGKTTPAVIHDNEEVEKRSQELTDLFGRTIDGFETFVAKARIQKHEERTWKYIRKDGSTLYVNLIVTAIRDLNNQITGFLGIANDITDKKEAEEELKRVSTRLAMATFAGGIGVWEMNLVTNELYADEQLFRLFGEEKKSPDDSNEAWLKNLYQDDIKRITEEIALAVKGEKQLNTEFRVVWPDGTIHSIRSIAIVQRNKENIPVGMIGIDWDITEQKQNEAILLRARQEAEYANKSKSVFLANMSHEIRTPLNAIIGFSQLMNRDKSLTSLQKEYSISIIRAGEHLLSLINDILELSKMEAGRLELNNKNIDLYALFADIQMLFKEPAKTKHLQFIFETAPDIPQYVCIDDNKLRRIFINLISNAIKFTDDGGVAVRIRVNKVGLDRTQLFVEIQDSGHGIAENEMDKLFKSFVQTSSGTKTNSGTGLGLALSRELAILMGGDISVKSEVGKGSVFSFFVDFKEGDKTTLTEIIQNKVVGFKKTNGDINILVADDVDKNRKVIVTLLNLVGFKTIEAVNGEDAITKFEKYNLHLILMDMRMPVMTGYEAIQFIKSTAKGKNIPIIALTASSFEDERRNIDRLGIQGYIRKPFRENELFNAIGNILEIRYIYESESVESTIEDSLLEEQVVEKLKRLPTEMTQEMNDAIEIADFERLIALIERISLEDKELSVHLLLFANNYDYNYFNTLLTQIR